MDGDGNRHSEAKIPGATIMSPKLFPVMDEPEALDTSSETSQSSHAAAQTIFEETKDRERARSYNSVVDTIKYQGQDRERFTGHQALDGVG